MSERERERERAILVVECVFDPIEDRLIQTAQLGRCFFLFFALAIVARMIFIFTSANVISS